jgi:ComF family protein
MHIASKLPLKSALQSVIATVLDAVLPPACLLCDTRVAKQGGLCPGCWGTMRFIERPFCEVLGMPFAYDMGSGTVSPAAIADPPPFDRLRASVLYSDGARRMVSGLKFADRGDLAPRMARWMAVAGCELLLDCHCITPVPLHWRRLHQRRYNQSAELARSIAKLSGKPYRPQILVRRRPTVQQVGLSAAARSRNVEGAFTVPAGMRSEISGRRVLLVDDVHTTGATVRACARVLKRAGASGVDVLTFAMVPSGDI